MLKMLKSLTIKINPTINGIKANNAKNIGAIFCPILVLNSSICPCLYKKLANLPHPM